WISACLLLGFSTSPAAEFEADRYAPRQRSRSPSGRLPISYQSEIVSPRTELIIPRIASSATIRISSFGAYSSRTIANFWKPATALAPPRLLDDLDCFLQFVLRPLQ